MKTYKIKHQKSIIRIYEVEANNEYEAIGKIENEDPEVHELVGQGSYDCDYAFTGA